MNTIMKQTHANNHINRRDMKVLNLISFVVNGVIALLCLIPFLLVLSGSFSSEQAIREYGFTLFPKAFSLGAYQSVFEKPAIIGRAYLNTIGITLVGTMLAVFLTSMTAYVLARQDFPWRNKFSFYFYFTTLFSGGLTPFYILMIRYLHLKNSYWALILPCLLSVFNLMMVKNYMRGIPHEMTEAALIDGCGDFGIYWRIMVPMSVPVLATIALFVGLGFWNEWYNCMLYIDREEMFTLQYFLYQKLNNIEAYKKIISQMGSQSSSMIDAIDIPTQSLKMALTVVVTGPVVLAYPLMQRYFVQGITVGAVKG